MSKGEIIAALWPDKDPAKAESSLKSSLFRARRAVHQDWIVYEDGKLFVQGAPAQAKTIQEIAFASHMASSLPDGMEPGLEALLTACARGADPRPAARALWNEFLRARDALVALAPPPGSHRRSM